jgi:putative transposase
MNVTRGGFYKHCNQIKKGIKSEKIKVAVAMKAIAKKTRYSYGSRRLSKKLKREGFKIGRYATRTLMKEFGVISKQRPKRQYFGSSGLKTEGENYLNRKFIVSKPNEVWCVDITYIQTKEGTLYLAGILDLYARKIIGYGMADNMQEELPRNALKMAIKMRNFKNGNILHHSDRGSQYVGRMYTDTLKEYSFLISLNGAGKCLDNAVKERFWGSLKSEWIRTKIYATRKEAEADILLFIDFYNTERLHSTLDYLTPNEFEQVYYKNITAPKKVSTFT